MTPKFDIEVEDTYSIHYIEDGAFLTRKNTVSYYNCKPVSDNLSCTLKTSKQISLPKAFSNIYSASVGRGFCMFGEHSDENNTLAVCIDSAHVCSTAQIEYKLTDVTVVLDSRHIKLLTLHDNPNKSFFRILPSSKSQAKIGDLANSSETFKFPIQPTRSDYTPPYTRVQILQKDASNNSLYHILATNNDSKNYIVVFEISNDQISPVRSTFMPQVFSKAPDLKFCPFGNYYLLASRSANKAYFQQASKSLDLSADGVIDRMCLTDAGIAALLVRRAGVYCSVIVDGLQVDDASSRVMREMCHGGEEVSVYEAVRAREAVLVVGMAGGMWFGGWTRARGGWLCLWVRVRGLRWCLVRVRLWRQ